MIYNCLINLQNRLRLQESLNNLTLFEYEMQTLLMNNEAFFRYKIPYIDWCVTNRHDENTREKNILNRTN